MLAVRDSIGNNRKISHGGQRLQQLPRAGKKRSRFRKGIPIGAVCRLRITFKSPLGKKQSVPLRQHRFPGNLPPLEPLPLRVIDSVVPCEHLLAGGDLHPPHCGKKRLALCGFKVQQRAVGVQQNCRVSHCVLRCSSDYRESFLFYCQTSGL